MPHFPLVCVYLKQQYVLYKTHTLTLIFWNSCEVFLDSGNRNMPGLLPGSTMIIKIHIKVRLMKTFSHAKTSYLLETTKV